MALETGSGTDPGAEDWASQLTALARHALSDDRHTWRPLAPEQRARMVDQLLGDLRRDAALTQTDPFVVLWASKQRLRVPLLALLSWVQSEAMPAELGIIRGVEHPPDPVEGVAAIRFAPVAHGWIEEDHTGPLGRLLRAVRWRLGFR